MALLEVMCVFSEAAEALVSVALAEGSISLPPSSSSLPLSQLFSPTKKQQGQGSGQIVGVTTGGLMPSGPSLEGFFEGLGLGRMQEGRRLKALCYAILEVR